MKINSSLFAVKERRDFKSESLVDALYSIYEQNFQIIDQLIFRTSIYQKKLKYSQELPMSLNLSSDYNVPDIQLGINYLSSFTADGEMYHKDSSLKNIHYLSHMKFRIFFDAKILEIKETGFLLPNFDKNNESEREEPNVFDNPRSVENKLTKSLLAQEWLNQLVKLKYTLNNSL